ncbi:MAG: glycosyltransferase family 2 protein [Lysobacteraceae bacterium]|nr:MAG: glycosyltransferase family 2 protein [Xanthomonadaceae bacterium]
MKSLVSVCIPTFNYGEFISGAIRSVLSQSFPDFELIVVDNASTDATAELMETFIRSDPRIRFYRNTENIGIVKNFNRALEHATGDYVKILCADDLLASSALERSLALIQSNPEVSLVTTGRLLVDFRLRPVGYSSYCSKEGSVAGSEVIDRCLFGTNYVGEPSAVLFRRRQATGGFDESYPHLLDMAMWFHLLEQGRLACTPEPLTYIRQHERQLTRDNQRTGQLLEDKKRIFSAYIAKPYVQKTALRMFLWRLRAAYSFWKGAYNAGRKISEFLPPILFYFLLPALVIADLLGRARSRVRAIGYMRQTSSQERTAA